ncbi:MAG TPA: HAD hydrolase-like protein [Flavobacteriaceae bacterium]|nr:HAD hydrolase-like protein [Flavobacteriaceae bacterium]
MAGNKSIFEYQNIIWDWNGTLLNDNWVCVEIVNKLLKNHNDRQLNLTTYKDVFGFPIVDYYKKIGIDLQKESFDELTEKFISDYESKVNLCELQKGATQILNQIKEQGKNQFILTAAHKKSVVDLLKFHSIDGVFKKVEGLDNHRAESKVDRGHKLIKENHISIENTVLVGDTIHDYEVATHLGIKSILIANGHQSKSRLIEKTKSEVPIYNNISELVI